MLIIASFKTTFICIYAVISVLQQGVVPSDKLTQLDTSCKGYIKTNLY